MGVFCHCGARLVVAGYFCRRVATAPRCESEREHEMHRTLVPGRNPKCRKGMRADRILFGRQRERERERKGVVRPLVLRGRVWTGEPSSARGRGTHRAMATRRPTRHPFDHNCRAWKIVSHPSEDGCCSCGGRCTRVPWRELPKRPLPQITPAKEHPQGQRTACRCHRTRPPRDRCAPGRPPTGYHHGRRRRLAPVF
jgi:hypothetical protein